MPELGAGLQAMQSFPDICWQLITVESRQSRKFLECVEGNSLLFADREGLVVGVVVGGYLGHSNHKIIISDPW